MNGNDKGYDTGSDRGWSKVRPKFPDQLSTPIWQPFCGFSFLFDNPGNSIIEEGKYAKLMADDFDNPDLVLYKKIANAVKHMDIEHLAREHQFFALPYNTYHVTVWDGVNTGNISHLAPKAQKEFNECFANPIESIIDNWPPVKIGAALANWFSGVGPIRFKYKDLRSRGTTVLVVELQPADEASAEELDTLIERRAKLDNLFSELGKSKNFLYRPHVAIGYFSDVSLAKAAMFQLMDNWIKGFNEELSEEILVFNSIGLYAFTDMITYLKPSFKD